MKNSVTTRYLNRLPGLANGVLLTFSVLRREGGQRVSVEAPLSGSHGGAPLVAALLWQRQSRAVLLLSAGSRGRHRYPRHPSYKKNLEQFNKNIFVYGKKETKTTKRITTMLLFFKFSDDSWVLALLAHRIPVPIIYSTEWLLGYHECDSEHPVYVVL
jgi:hypothetical protein